MKLWVVYVKSYDWSMAHKYFSDQNMAIEYWNEKCSEGCHNWYIDYVETED